MVNRKKEETGMDRQQIGDIIATKNAPLVIGEGRSEKYRRVVLKNEGYVILLAGSSLEMEELVIYEQNPAHDFVARGKDGEDGAPGCDGEDAFDGGRIELFIGRLSDNIRVVNQGGKGGDGGFGGRGGDGGAGFMNGKGAPGGDGGNGGNGGRGGKGPALVLKYATDCGSSVETVCEKGPGGSGGVPGSGGNGGRNGNSDTFAPDGKPGERGKDGEPGEKGSVEIVLLNEQDSVTKKEGR